MDSSIYPMTPNEFRIVDRHEEENSVTYELVPLKEPTVCTTCGFEELISHGNAERRARDLNEFNKRVGLIIHLHRYKCQNCHSTLTPSFKSIDPRAKMTNRMRTYIQDTSLKQPFSRIKDELDVSVPTIKGIFEDYVAALDAKREVIAPKVLGMDENYLNKKYRCIYTDIENGLIIDLTADRKLYTVQRWIARLPEKDRIECATMDMWGCYKDAVNAELPGVPIVVDKFHVIKNLNEALDATRKGMKDSLTSKQVLEMKNSRFLLLQNNDELSESDKIRLEILLTNYPQFREPYELKESFRKLYETSDRKTAEEIFKDWRVNAVKYPLFETFVNTVDNWYEEIFNYFDKGYTNAVTEALNAVCKEIAAVGRGYTFDVLRAKILYGTKATKPAKYHYYDKDTSTKKKEPRDIMTYGDGVYQLMSRIDTSFEKKPSKHIEVSSGVDIRLLEYYLRMQNLWELKP